MSSEKDKDDINIVSGEGGDRGAQHLRRGHQRGRWVSPHTLRLGALIGKQHQVHHLHHQVHHLLHRDLQAVGFPPRGWSTTPTMATTTMTLLFLRSLLRSTLLSQIFLSQIFWSQIFWSQIFLSQICLSQICPPDKYAHPGPSHRLRHSFQTKDTPNPPSPASPASPASFVKNNQVTQLSEDITFTANIKPACLPTR